MKVLLQAKTCFLCGCLLSGLLWSEPASAGAMRKLTNASPLAASVGVRIKLTKKGFNPEFVILLMRLGALQSTNQGLAIRVQPNGYTTIGQDQ